MLLPLKLLDKIVIREFGVDENVASRVSGYFVDGLKEFGLIDSNNVLQGVRISEKSIAEDKNEADETTLPRQVEKIPQPPNAVMETDTSGSFTVHIYGPGLNNKIKIEEEEDLLIVEATLKKVKKALKEPGNQA